MNDRIPSSQRNRNKSRTSFPETGNALIYVLIAIALFASLSFTVARQTNNQEAATLAPEEIELLASRIIGYASQAESVIEQMNFAGSRAADLEFPLPGEAAYDTGSDIHKVYHPQGGGLIPGKLSEQMVSQTTSDPPPGWYMGRFNNVEWTDGIEDDVILTAFQISQAVCQNLNEKITGSTDIPVVGGADLEDVLIDDRFYSGGSNVEFTLTQCPDCAEYHALCVSNGAGTMWAYYNILAAQ
jgi:hypothetical protein